MPMFHTAEQAVSSPPLKQGFTLGLPVPRSYQFPDREVLKILPRRPLFAIHLSDLNSYLALWLQPIGEEAVILRCGIAS